MSRSRKTQEPSVRGLPGPLTDGLPSRSALAADVADRLHDTVVRLIRRMRWENEAVGLTAPAMSALGAVVTAGPLRVGELAAQENVRSPTMTRMITSLEAAGLVRREADPDDGRAVRVRATPEGTRVLKAGRRRRVAAMLSELEELTPGELDAVLRAIRILERIGNVPFR